MMMNLGSASSLISEIRICDRSPFRQAEPEKAEPGNTYGETSTSVMHSAQLNARRVGRGAGPLAAGGRNMFR